MILVLIYSFVIASGTLTLVRVFFSAFVAHFHVITSVIFVNVSLSLANGETCLTVLIADLRELCSAD